MAAIVLMDDGHVVWSAYHSVYGTSSLFAHYTFFSQHSCIEPSLHDQLGFFVENLLWIYYVTKLIIRKMKSKIKFIISRMYYACAVCVTRRGNVSPW